MLQILYCLISLYNVSLFAKRNCGIDILLVLPFESQITCRNCNIVVTDRTKCNIFQLKLLDKRTNRSLRLVRRHARKTDVAHVYAFQNPFILRRRQSFAGTCNTGKNNCQCKR